MNGYKSMRTYDINVNFNRFKALNDSMNTNKIQQIHFENLIEANQMLTQSFRHDFSPKNEKDRHISIQSSSEVLEIVDNNQESIVQTERLGGFVIPLNIKSNLKCSGQKLEQRRMKDEIRYADLCEEEKEIPSHADKNIIVKGKHFF